MTMFRLVITVLFLHHAMHCEADGQDSNQLYTHFDNALYQTIYAAQRDNFMEFMTSVFKTINTFDACLVTSKQQWKALLAIGPSHFPKICGSIGYVKAEPVSLIWTLETDSAVLLNVTYLELPYLGLGCPSTRLIISARRDAMYCGRRSHWEVYAPNSIIVYLQQYIRLPGSSGFVATYFSVDITSIYNVGTKYRLESAPGGWYVKTTPTLFHSHNGPYNIAPEFSWHFVTNIYKVIHFKVENNTECQIYDGPGRLSPVLHDVNQSSAFHLYVVQSSPHLMLEYSTGMQTSFNTKQHVVLSSHPSRNIVYGYQVEERNTALRISFLSIHSREIITDIDVTTKCFFGGFFIANFRNVLDVCDTHWNKEVYIILTDENYITASAQNLIFVIMYGSYTDGKVAISVESASENCEYREHSLTSSHFDVDARCNQLLYAVPYKLNSSFSPMFRSPRSGPVDLKIHLHPLIYDLYDIQLNITVGDSDILGFDRIIRTDIVETSADLHYQNPDQFIVREIQGKYFSTWRLAIITFTREALCVRNLRHSFHEYTSLPQAQMITLNPYESRCSLTVDGLTDYNIAIVATDNNINVAVSFNEQCAIDCQNGKITFTEYSTIYDSLIIHNFASFPAFWENIHTNNSVQMNIRVSHSCRRCTLWVVVGPGERARWQHNLHLSPQKRDKIKTHRLLHPTL